jgi:hypothetical protein
VVSQLIFVGAKQVAIDKALCDCRWATEQLISQHRTLEMVYGINDWLVTGSLFLAGLGMLAIPALVSRQPLLSVAWARASQALAVVFFVAVLAVFFQVDITSSSSRRSAASLLPVWAPTRSQVPRRGRPHRRGRPRVARVARHPDMDPACPERVEDPPIRRRCAKSL